MKLTVKEACALLRSNRFYGEERKATARLLRAQDRRVRELEALRDSLCKEHMGSKPKEVRRE